MANLVAYRGPSQVDGRTVLVILNDNGANEATGPMIQAYICLADQRPTEARKCGNDRAVCADCKRRTWLWSQLLPDERVVRCYVMPFVVDAVWKTAKDLPLADDKAIRRMLRGRELRVTAYGEAPVVPMELWTKLLGYCRGWTGYTHMWRDCDPSWSAYLMASVDTEEEAREAAAKGWRYFRPRAPGKDLISGEIECLKQGGEYKCHSCLLCRGQNRGKWSRVRNISIIEHGFLSPYHYHGALREQYAAGAK